MRDSEGLGWVFQKDELGRIELRIRILATLFSFKKVRGQKLLLTDVDGKGAFAIEDKSGSLSSDSSSSCSYSSSSSSSTTDEHSCRSELVQGLVHPGDGRNSAFVPSFSKTSSSSDRRRDSSVSNLKSDSPKED